MKEIMSIIVDIKMYKSVKYDNKTMQVIYFTGKAIGDYFTGQIVEPGIDVQEID